MMLIEFHLFDMFSAIANVSKILAASSYKTGALATMESDLVTWRKLLDLPVSTK